MTDKNDWNWCAEWSDQQSGDWPIVNGSSVTACVVSAERRYDGEPQRYCVSGESIPHYDAAWVTP